MRTFTCLLLACALIACGGSSTNTSDSPDEQQVETTAETARLGSIPTETMQYLAVNCDYVDIIFYNNPVSMNQDDPASIRRALLFVDPQPASINSDCSPDGRISYMADGEIVAEADMYLGSECNFMVFIENGEPVYANELSAMGQQFFEDILKQVQNAGN